MSAFFILTSQQAEDYRFKLFQQIHQIVFHGNGGYSWPDVYSMPIWLRKFTFSEIQKHYDEVNNSTKQSSKSDALVNPDGSINVPTFKKVSESTSKISYK